MVIFKLPVSANALQVRSVEEITNVHRTKVMQATDRRRAQGQGYQNYQPTTCMNIAGRYEGGVYKNPEKVCDIVQGRPETGRSAMATIHLLRYSRVSTSQPQMMLPKQLVHGSLTNQNPYNMAMTPRQLMMRPLLRASLRPSQRPTQGVIREPAHATEGNRDYQEYQMILQATHSDNGNRDHQKYPSLMPHTNIDTVNRDPQEYPPLPHADNPDNGDRDQQDYPQHAPPDNNRNTEHPEYPALPPAAHSEDDQQDYQLLPQKEDDANIDQRAHVSTSTAVPVPNQGQEQQIVKPTTSTMPPFPGGMVPGGGGSGEPPQLCGGKAKCNQFIWTTKKKPTKPPKEQFMLWSP